MPDQAFLDAFKLLDKKAQRAKIAEYEKLLKQQQRAKEEYLAIAPYLGFQPNPSQYRWLQMLQKGIDEGIQKFGVFDGNSSGKTLWLVNLLYNVLCPADARNPWFELPFLKDWKWGKTKRHTRLVCKSEDLKDQTGMMWKL